MKQLLITILIGATLACHATEKLSPEEQQLEKELTINRELSLSRGPKLLALVTEHAFLRAPRVNGYTAIWSCIREDGTFEKPYPTQNVQALMDLGIDIDQADHHGRTALMEYATGESLDCKPIVRGLLDHKADPTKQDNKGFNAFGIALTSNRSGENILMLASHPRIAAIVNNPMQVNTRMKTPLNALITTSSDIYREKSVTKLLDAGAQITIKDICDALDPDRPYETLLNRCSLEQLRAALPLVEHEPLICKFSKKEKLCKAIQEKTDTDLPDLVTITRDDMPEQESK